MRGKQTYQLKNSTGLIGLSIYSSFHNHLVMNMLNEKIPKKANQYFQKLFHSSTVLMLLFLLIGIYQEANGQCTINSYVPSTKNRIECTGESVWFRVNYTITTEPEVIWQYIDDGIGDTDGPDNLPGWQTISGSGALSSISTVSGNFASAYTRLDLSTPGATYEEYQFRVVFNGGSCSNVVSDAFTYDLNGTFSITGQPSAANICETTTSQGFAVTASNNVPGTLTYLWQYSTTGVAPWTNMTNVNASGSGFNTANLMLNNTHVSIWPTAGSSVFVRCRVAKTGCDNQFSNAVELNVDIAPTLSLEDDITICSTGNTEITATLGGSATSVSWFGSGTFSPSATANPVTYNNTSTGTYTLTATTNSNDACIEANSTINVSINSLSINTYTPSGKAATRCAGQSQTFTIEVTGDPAPNFQWQVDDGTDFVDIAGEENATLNLTGITAAMDGNQYQCIVTAGECSLISDAFTLNVDGPITINTQPSSVTDICITQESADFTIDASTGSGTLTYQWQSSPNGTSGWTNITGETSSSYTIENGDGLWPAAVDMSVYFRCVLDAGVCNVVNSAVVHLGISAQGPVTVDAGTESYLCKDGTTLALNGIVSPTNAGTWTSSAGGTFSDPSAPSASTFTPASGFTGDVTLTLTSYDPAGPCPVVTDAVVITVVGVDAGANLAVCYPDLANISAVVSGTSSTDGTWATVAGDGTFADNTANSTTYTPGNTDALETLSFTHTASGCSDELTLTVNKITQLSANKLRTVCEGSALPSGTPFRQNRTTYPDSYGNTDVWEYSSDGNDPWVSVSSMPDAATSMPTIAGTNGRSDLYFAGTIPNSYTGSNFRVIISEGECRDTIDGFILTVNQAAVVDAGDDVTVCYNSGDVSLSPTFSGGATSSTWNVLMGSGSVSANIYSPTLADAGNYVQLELVSNDPSGPCPVDKDTVLITFNHVSIGDHFPSGLIRNTCEGQNTTFRVNYSSAPPATVTWQYRENPSANWQPIGSLGTITSPSGGTQLNLMGVTTDQDGYQFIALFTSGECVDIESSIFTLNVGHTGTVSAGDDIHICEIGGAAQLAGLYTGGYTSATWSGGAGTFSSTSDLNATYIPDASEAGNMVTLTLTTNNPPGGCGVMTDNVNIYIPSGINAGPDGTVCHDGTLTLAGASIGAPVTSATWTTLGDGTFSDPLGLAGAVYTPGTADVVAGSVVLRLTSNNDPDGAGGCAMYFDEKTLIVEQLQFTSYTPTTKTISTCDGEEVTLSVTTSAVSTPSYQWLKASTSGGSFTPVGMGDSAYTFTAVAADSGYVYKVAVTPSAGCGGESDEFIVHVNGPISITVQPTNVGPICNSTTSASFTSTAMSNKGIPSLQWEYSTVLAGPYTDISGFGSTSTDLILNNTAAFWPSLGQTIYVRMKASLPDCDIVYSNGASLSIDPVGPAIVNAGPDQSINCNASSIITLAGSVSGTGTSATWTTTTGGSFSDPHSPSGTPGFPSTYTLTNAEMLSGSVTLTLTSNNPSGVCDAVSDQMTITINNTGSINAGVDMTVCSGAAPITLSGTNGPPTIGTVTWSTAGTGTFSANNILSPTYSPSAPDRSAGSVILTLTRNATPTCPSMTDTKLLTISNTGNVTAGADQTVCFGSPVSLNGNYTSPVTSVTWSVISGPNTSASQFADTHDPDTQFIPTVGGTYVLLITSNSGLSGACPQVSDQVSITVESINITGHSPISLQPYNCAGAPTNMSITFTGSTGLNTSYNRQWEFVGKTNSGSNIITWTNVTGSNHSSASGQTTTSLSFIPTYYQNGNTYRLKISKNGCTTYSNIFTLSVPSTITFSSTTSPLLNQCSNLPSATFSTIFTENDPLGNSDVTLRWQSSATGTSGWTDVPSTVTGYDMSSITLVAMF